MGLHPEHLFARTGIHRAVRNGILGPAEVRRKNVGAAWSRAGSRGCPRMAGPSVCFDQLTVSVSVTLWLTAEDPEPVVPVTVSV